MLAGELLAYIVDYLWYFFFRILERGYNRFSTCFHVFCHVEFHQVHFCDSGTISGHPYSVPALLSHSKPVYHVLRTSWPLHNTIPSFHYHFWQLHFSPLFPISPCFYPFVPHFSPLFSVSLVRTGKKSVNSYLRTHCRYMSPRNTIRAILSPK